MYIVTSTLTDPYKEDIHDTSDVYPDLEAANEAARQFGDVYGFGIDQEGLEAYEEELTSDGRLTIHMDNGEGNTFDVELKAKLEVTTSDEIVAEVNQQGKPEEEQELRHAEGVRERKTKSAFKEDQRYVYILTHEEYDTEEEDYGPVEIIGVYASVATANIAASVKATEDDVTSDDDEEDSSEEFNNWVERHDRFGCITISKDDGLHEHWRFTVTRHVVRGIKNFKL